jgi:hypothetical protein
MKDNKLFLKSPLKWAGGKRQIITKNEKNFLQSALASAIANRKKNLMEHEDSDSDEDDSDW